MNTKYLELILNVSGNQLLSMTVKKQYLSEWRPLQYKLHKALKSFCNLKNWSLPAMNKLTKQVFLQ